MPHAVKFSDSDVLIEVEEPDPAAPVALVARSSADAVVYETTEKFEQAVDRVRPMAAAVIEKLRQTSNNLAEVEVEFGLKFGVESGVIVAKGSAEGNFRVTLTWKRT